MKARILLGTSFLNGLTGSELMLFDLACGLCARDYDVRVWVMELVADSPLPKLLRAKGVSVSSDLPAERSVDAVIFQLKETFETWRDSYLGVPRLAICHGPKLPAEIAPADLPELRHVALTREGHRHLVNEGYERVVFTGYGIDLARFTPTGPLPDRATRAVVHSKYCDVDLVRAACDSVGVELVELGRQSWGGLDSNRYASMVEVRADGTVIDHEPSALAFHVERIIGEAHIVFGLGRSAVEAMAMGKACVVYGYGTTGDGMVAADRLDALAAVNFSGRARPRDFGVQAMIEELALYTPEMGKVNRDYARRHYDLDRFLDRVEELLRRREAWWRRVGRRSRAKSRL